MRHEENLPGPAGGRQSGAAEKGATERRAAERRAAEKRAAGKRAAACVAAALVLAACGRGGGSAPAPGPSAEPAVDPASTAPEASGRPVVLGVDVLLRDRLRLVRGRRIGLITNHTGVSWPEGDSAVSTIDRLARAPGVELVALFSPEHGIRGDIDRKVASSVDERTGLPIHSLYGETRKPTPAMLIGIDALVFDIQDIGTRYYSYVWTMALAMEAAAEHGLRFVVLDRPNPIGGGTIQGNVRPSYMPVAYYEAAMRHGLTAGELARYVAAEYDLGVDLHVVPMDGWRRELWWEETGVPWRAPSPNMPSVESATHYPGTCLFEGTNLSVGRGTPIAFQQFGAPWLDAPAVAAALRSRDLPGVAVEAVEFVPSGPTDGKFPGQVVRGIRLRVTDRSRYDPVRAAIAALLEIRARHPEELVWREGWFDGLAGGPRLREMIQADSSLDAITRPWPAERAAFDTLRQRYLLYP